MEVSGCGQALSQAIAKQADTAIARTAQQASDIARDVVMVNNQRLWLLAYGTDTTLMSLQCLPGLFRQVV